MGFAGFRLDALRVCAELSLAITVPPLALQQGRTFDFVWLAA